MSAAIAGLLKKLALDLGKLGYNKLTERSPLHKAIFATIDSLPDIEARPSLTVWCESDEFALLLEGFKAGDRTLTDESVISSFIDATDFYMEGIAQTRRAAGKVLTTFAEKLQDEIYDAPGGISAFAKREEELHDRTYRSILHLKEQVLSDRQSEHLVAPSNLVEACREVTGRAAHELIDNQRTIVRESVRARIDEFLLSQTRYCFILGPTGVGKSIIMAQEAERLPGAGWTALLVLGASFSLERTIALIAQELPRRVERLDLRRITEPWRAGSSPISSGLVVLIDAIEAADENVAARQLRLLHEGTSDLPLKRFKVIVSCRDLVWSRFRHNRTLPFYEDADRLRRRSGRGSLSLRVSDFKPHELDHALLMIRAAELLNAGRRGQEADPHTATLRDLLKHPGTFEHYASLHEGDDVSSLQNLTWSGLIGQRIATCLNRAERLSGTSVKTLFNYLALVASLGWKRGSHDFQIGRDLIGEALPGIYDKQPQATHSAYEALLETGALNATSNGLAGSSVGFRITDAGAYLLSFELEKQVAGKNPEETRALVAEWLVKASNYYPLLDALLAFMDRLATNPFNPGLLILIEALVEKYHFHSGSIFKLVSPAIITSIFEIIKQESRRDYFAYRDAALEIRASPESLSVMRRHLCHPNPLARELAAQLAGVHRDATATAELIGLLEDAEREVRHRAYVSLSRINKPAIAPLIEVITNISQPAKLRSSCIGALRGIGFRDESITKAIGDCLSDGQNSDTDLLHSALLAAAHLRDCGHRVSAARVLRHEDWKVVQAAAKYLKEVPTHDVFDQILSALSDRLDGSADGLQRHLDSSQLLAALFTSDREKSSPVIIRMIEDGLNGNSGLSPMEALHIATKFGGAAARRPVLKHLVAKLSEDPEHPTVWSSVDLLGSTWKRDELLPLIEAAKDLEKGGVDLARIFVDAIIPGTKVSEEWRIGHQLNRVSDLDSVIKCGASNFVPEATRLLRQAQETGGRQLCKLLWIVADARAEDELLNRLEHPVSQNTYATIERASAVRALGTCSTMRGAGAVLAYLRSEQDISYYLHEETLWPLLCKKLIRAQDLVSIAQSADHSAGGRAASMLALARLDVHEHRGVFAEVAENTDDEIVQLYAARMLGFTRDASAVPVLIRLLQTSNFLRVKSEVAKALTRLEARETIHDIEHALQREEDPGFIKALARFGEVSSLLLVVEGAKQRRGQLYRDYLRAIGAFWKYEPAREVILEEFEQWVKGGARLFDDQSPLIEGLARHEPNLLLERFNLFYDDGYLNSSARQTLASLILPLFRDDRADRVLLLETAKRLICDRSVPTREMAAQAIGQTDRNFCSSLYNKLASADEWSRSCAVYALGFWDSDIDQLRSARYDAELLVRQAADAAWEVRENANHLKWHVERFGSGDGLTRLSAYMCLEKHGDIRTIWQLNEGVSERSFQRTFLRNLSDNISERLRKEQREKQDKEEKLEETRGTIWFD